MIRRVKELEKMTMKKKMAMKQVRNLKMRMMIKKMGRMRELISNATPTEKPTLKLRSRQTEMETRRRRSRRRRHLLLNLDNQRKRSKRKWSLIWTGRTDTILTAMSLSLLRGMQRILQKEGMLKQA